MERQRATRERAVWRLVWAVALASGLVVGAVALPSYAEGPPGHAAVEDGRAEAARPSRARPHATRRAPAAQPQRPEDQERVSRAGETGKDVRDPSTFLTPRPRPAAVAARADDDGPAADAGPARCRSAPGSRPTATRWPTAATASAGRRSTSSRPTSASTSSTRATGSSSSTAGRRRAPSDATVWTARAAQARLHVHQRRQAAGASKGKRTFRLQARPRAAPPTRRPASTSPAGRTAA